jgi:hypothetical protein
MKPRPANLTLSVYYFQKPGLGTPPGNDLIDRRRETGYRHHPGGATRMATQRQIDANRRNATLSTGPSEASKSRTRLNATKHGLASQLSTVETASGEFESRRARWEPEYQPVGEGANWALDQAVASSIRIEACGRSLDVLVVAERKRSALAWDQDRSVEAATTFARLTKDPILASRQLETSRAGVMLLLDAWFGLCQSLDAGEDWSETEASMALDLLGVSPHFRSRRMPIDPPEGVDAILFRNALVEDEIERLEALRDEVMAPLDEMDHEIAMTGDLALLSKPATLILRYEREAWKRYRDAMKELQAPAPVVEPTKGVAPALIVERPKGVERNEANSVVKRNEANRDDEEFLAERKSLLEESRKLLSQYADQSIPVALKEQSEWFDDLHRRLHGPSSTSRRPIPGNFVPIAAGG